APALGAGRSYEVTPLYGIPAIASYPFNGSAIVVWDSGTPTPPTTNTPNNGGADPHSKPRSNVDARTQKAEFLTTNGAVVDVCSGMRCPARGGGVRSYPNSPGPGAVRAGPASIPLRARATSAALASPAAARRSRVPRPEHARVRPATREVSGRALKPERVP